MPHTLSTLTPLDAVPLDTPTLRSLRTKGIATHKRMPIEECRQNSIETKFETPKILKTYDVQTAIYHIYYLQCKIVLPSVLLHYPS